MSAEGSKTDLMSQSENIRVSEDLQSSQTKVIAAVGEDLSLASLVASNSTPVVEVLVLDETSGAASNADIAKESVHSATTNRTESSDASIASSAVEESGDSGTSLVKSGEKKIRKVSFAEGVFEEDGGTAAAGTSSDSTTPTRVAGEDEDRLQFSTEFVNYCCCPEYRGPYGYFRIKMMYFRESKYLLLFQFLLLAMPLASGFVGAKNIYACPASPAVAILFFMMGIIGTVFLCGRIYGRFKKALFSRSSWEDPTDGLPMAGALLLAILFTTELACFFNMEPEFSDTRAGSKFCDANFYYFARGMNYSGIALIVLLLMLYCPGYHPCTRTHVPHVTHELIGGLD